MTLLSEADRRLIDGLRAGVCTGPGPCDSSPFSASTSDNWVARVGGLPLYMRAVAKAIVRQGRSESEAIATAVATMKRWAAGGGNVTAATRARAEKALAEWEKMKAEAHGSRDAGVRFDITQELRSPDGKWVKGDLNELKTDLNTGQKRPLGDILMDVHKGQVARKAEMAAERAKRKASRRPLAKQEPKVVAEWNKGDPLPGDAKKTDEEEHKVDGETVGRIGKYHSTSGHVSGWYAEHQGTHHPIVFPTKHEAVDALERWHVAHTAGGDGPVTPASQARVAKALAEWEAKKAKAHGSRAVGPVTEGGSAGSLLPVGPSPKVAATVEAKLALATSDGAHPKAAAPHAFRGRDLAHCGVCGQPATAAIHHTRTMAAGLRHAGPGHHPVPTGHIADNPTRRRMAHKKAFVADAERIEPHLHQAMADLFEKQAKRTLSALNGNRGRRIRAMVRAAQPPDQPDGPDGAQPPAGQQPAPDAQAIFDLAFWADQTAQAAMPALDQAGQASIARVGAQLGLDQPVTSSVAGVEQILRDRANRLAGQVTDTTFAQIQQALADGIADGEGITQLADRIRHVFDVARSRAELIARTETTGAMNEAAHTYATNLPPGTVGRKEWLAVHDTRTRAAHRVADGQKVPIWSPFVVGSSLMMHPGDPTAPPDEVCNCRCSLLYLPGPGPADAGGINPIGGSL